MIGAAVTIAIFLIYAVVGGAVTGILERRSVRKYGHPLGDEPIVGMFWIVFGPVWLIAAPFVLLFSIARSVHR